MEPKVTQPRWIKPMNMVMKAAHRLGIPIGPPMILTVPGRKSGQPRSTPVTPFDHEGALYVVSGFPGSDWSANAKAAGAGTLKRGRVSRRVRIVELSAVEADPVLRTFAAKVPMGVKAAKQTGLVRTGSADEFAALAGLLTAFRFDDEDPLAHKGSQL